jgi:hypothetical protein
VRGVEAFANRAQRRGVGLVPSPSVVSSSASRSRSSSAISDAALRPRRAMRRAWRPVRVEILRGRHACSGNALMNGSVLENRWRLAPRTKKGCAVEGWSRSIAQIRCPARACPVESTHRPVRRGSAASCCGGVQINDYGDSTLFPERHRIKKANRIVRNIWCWRRRGDAWEARHG